MQMKLVAQLLHNRLQTGADGRKQLSGGPSAWMGSLDGEPGVKECSSHRVAPPTQEEEPHKKPGSINISRTKSCREASLLAS